VDGKSRDISRRSMKKFSHVPFLGTGVGFRRELKREMLGRRGDIEVVEVIAERFFAPENEMYLEELSATLPVIPHGIELSIGGAEGLDPVHLKNVSKVCRRAKAHYFSDHFALTKIDGMSINHLSPLWFTREQAKLVINHIREVEDRLGIPLVLENITSMFDIPSADYSEAEFISLVLEKADAGLHLDIANVLINSVNRSFDPMIFLRSLPLERVVQIHLAGGTMFQGWFFDSHSEPISGHNEGVWPLFEWVLPRTPNLKAVIIERDENFTGNFDSIIGIDLRRTQQKVNDFFRTKYGGQV
jgi:uncharacterized protein